MYWNVIWYCLFSSLILSDYILVYVGMYIYIYDYSKCAACSVRNDVNVTVSYVSIYVMHTMYMYDMYRGKLQ